MLHFDLVIVGGGLVGRGLLLALINQSCYRNIALIDQNALDYQDPRLFALNMSSWQFLKNIKIADALVPDATAIQSVQVSHAGQFGNVRLKAEEMSLQALGYMVPAQQIEIAMQQALSSLQPLFTHFRPAKLTTITQDENQSQPIVLTMKNEEGEQTISADYVIATDGTNSSVRQLLALPTTIDDYQQSAIVTRVKLNRSHHHIAYERFIRDGAIAMLPLPDDQVATIWTMAKDQALQLKSLTDAEFLFALQQAFGYRLGRLQEMTQRYLFPLQRVSVSQMYEKRVLLLGNSAHTLHPIAAQGLNLALYEIAALMDLLRAKNFARLDEVFKKLADDLSLQQTISSGVSHGLVKLFFKGNAITKIFLPIGMMAFDKLIPVKKAFISRMLGRKGHTPEMLMSEQ